MSCRKRFCKFGGGQTILMKTAGEHSPGWSRSPAAAPSIGCGLTGRASGSPPQQRRRTGMATQPQKQCGREEMLAPHALDALDTTDARAFEDHLSGCAECGAELADWRDSAALLAHAATPNAPSDALRARILSAAKQTTEASARVVAMPPRRASNLWPTLLRMAAAVAFIALIGGVLWL